MGCNTSQGAQTSTLSGRCMYGYWGMRGNGQIGRLLLAYTGINFEDIKYTSPAQWFGKDKLNLGLPFPNLPYIIDGSFKLTQSKAVCHYIIKKSGKVELLGKDLKDKARVESLVSVLADVKQLVQALIFNPQWKNKVTENTNKLVPKLDEFAKFYGDKQFALGYITLVDFYVSEYSYHIEKVLPEVYAKYPFLNKTRTAFQNLPEIKKYYSSDTAMKAPFFSAPAANQF